MEDTQTETINDTPEPAEAPAEAAEAIPAPAEAPGLSANLRAIMDRENALRQREQQVKAFERAKTEVEELRALAKQDPIKFLESHGVTMENLEAMKTEDSDPTSSLRREIEQLKSRIELQQKQDDESRRTAELAGMKNQLDEWINKSDRFPFVRAAEASGLVLDKMVQHYETTGEELSEEQAANAIEAEIKKLATKLVPLLGDQVTTTPDVKQTTTTTLTNQQAAAATRRDISSLKGPEALKAASELLRFIEDN